MSPLQTASGATTSRRVRPLLQLHNQPRAEREWGCPHRNRQVGRAHPVILGDLVGRRRDVARHDRPVHGAHLVLDDSGCIHSPVSKVGQHRLNARNCGAEFAHRPALDRGSIRFVGSRMPAKTIRPHAGPRCLGQGATGDEHIARFVEEMTRECEVQRGLARVHRGFEGGSDA